MKINIRLFKGSALVETTVLMVVMLPLIFALSMVGKLIDLKQTTEQASRYTSWESTVGAERSGSLSNESVRERFFSDAETPIYSQAQHAAVNAMWGDSNESMGQFQSASTVVLDQSSIDVHISDNAVPQTAAMKIGEAAARSGEILEDVSGNSWALSADGPSSITVSAQIESSSWLPASLSECTDGNSNVCLSSRAVILGDSWSASDDSQAEQRVRSLMPATVLEPVGNAVSIVGNLPMFQELKDLRGAFGHVDMGILPEYIE